MAPRAAFLSFRFGPTDGVSVVARSWIEAFRDFGYDVVDVTGGPESDRCVHGLGLGLGIDNADADADADSASGPDIGELERALADVDLVVVENLLTIPVNLPASRAAARVLAGRPALLHHHDPPWHRERFAHVTELPADDPAWRHVAINHILSEELAARGIRAPVVYNAFEPPPPRTASELATVRERVRGSLGVGPDDWLVAHPVRAIERKNVPAAIELCERLGATYWLLGPPEEGYERELEQIFDTATCPVVHRSWPDRDEFYAAADHVTFPSTWEGFGNPPIEAALQRRSVSVGAYPVAAELRAHGFDWFAPDDVEGIRRPLENPDAPATTKMLDQNERVAKEHFGIREMRSTLRRLLDEAGWLP
jgi:mannosylglucosylglycerate synthase